MKINKRLVALVPMRHHSIRVPGKNYRPLAGIPLYSYILKSLISCSEISEIVIDTDSPIIQDGVRSEFPAVRLIERPEELRGSSVAMNEVIMHDVTKVQADFYVQTHSTNPFLRPETISHAINEFIRSYPGHDSLLSVTPFQMRLWDSAGNPINHDPKVLLRTQDLKPLYVENSCLYIFERETFLERRNRLGKHPLMFEVNAEEALDIDNELDFAIAECLMLRKIPPHS